MYGLLGKSLSHSLSKTIHETMTPSMDYHLYETDDLKNFFRARPFKAINVTHPYKEACVPFLDVLDETAKTIGVVNTIIDENGRLVGYNTDLLALKHLIRTYFPDDPGTKTAIIGNGATSKSIVKAMEALGYQTPSVYARNPNEGEFHLGDIEGNTAIEVIVHATPVGMYPDNEGALSFSLDSFMNLKLVFDLIYNPLRTNLLMKAEKLGVPVMNGLEMLVEQARESQKRFFRDYDPPSTHSIVNTIRRKITNVTLIGLPFSGKSHFGRLLKDRLDKPLIDIDQSIENAENAPVHAIFKKKGEAYFRKTEEAKVIEVAKRYGQIIIPGGGIIMNERAMRTLKQNSVIIFLDLNLNLIDEDVMKGRPLAKTPEALERLKEERQPLYEQYADHIIAKDTWDESTIMQRIEEALDEHFDPQRTQS